MRSFWVGTGWKMNHLRKDAEEYAGRLSAYLAATELDFNVFIVPPFTVLADVCQATQPAKLLRRYRFIKYWLSVLYLLHGFQNRHDVYSGRYWYQFRNCIRIKILCSICRTAGYERF